MSPTEIDSLKKYFKRTRILLGLAAGVLSFFALMDLLSGMMHNFVKSNGSDSMLKVWELLTPWNLGGPLKFNLLLAASISYMMIDILKEFETGRFFSDKVLSSMRKIGIFTEIACYLLIPLAVVTDIPNLVKNDLPLQFVLNISYAGGAAGTFIRYFSKLIPIGRALEESDELTV